MNRKEKRARVLAAQDLISKDCVVMSYLKKELKEARSDMFIQDIQSNKRVAEREDDDFI